MSDSQLVNELLQECRSQRFNLESVSLVPTQFTPGIHCLFDLADYLIGRGAPESGLPEKPEHVGDKRQALRLLGGVTKWAEGLQSGLGTSAGAWMGQDQNAGRAPGMGRTESSSNQKLWMDYLAFHRHQPELDHVTEMLGAAERMAAVWSRLIGRRVYIHVYRKRGQAQPVRISVSDVDPPRWPRPKGGSVELLSEYNEGIQEVTRTIAGFPGFITANELAKRHKCSLTAVCKACRRGAFAGAFKSGPYDQWIIPIASVTDFPGRRGRKPHSRVPTPPAPPVPIPERLGVAYRDIPGFPGFRAGSDGTIWSCVWKGIATDRWRELRPRVGKADSNNRYPKVSLCVNGIEHQRMVHLLVLTTFIGPCPPGMTSEHYPDPDLNNNRVENLRWAPHRRSSRRHVEDPEAGNLFPDS
jgi:hypothetical protein